MVGQERTPPLVHVVAFEIQCSLFPDVVSRLRVNQRILRRCREVVRKAFLVWKPINRLSTQFFKKRQTHIDYENFPLDPPTLNSRHPREFRATTSRRGTFYISGTIRTCCTKTRMGKKKHPNRCLTAIIKEKCTLVFLDKALTHVILKSVRN